MDEKVYLSIVEGKELTVGELTMQIATIPSNAKIGYEGCGSHTIVVADASYFDGEPMTND